MNPVRKLYGLCASFSRAICFLLLGVLCACISCSPRATVTQLPFGTNPYPISPPPGGGWREAPGGERAFLAESSIEWVESGPGNAAYPAWTPDGALIYTYGHDTETAYEAWKSNSQSGYGLRIRYPDGSTRDLTHGRCRDYTPCVSPDGKTVYFVTTRGVESESASFSKAAATRLAALDLATGKVKILLDAPNGSNSGYAQPAISPDGRLLIWAQLDSFFDTWRIYGARLSDVATTPSSSKVAKTDILQQSNNAPASPQRRLSPPSITALSPRFHPNGRIICFTGFRAGDPAWGVWVADLHTGKVRRLCSGENPCFSPDGSSIAYDRDGMLYLCQFTAADEPNTLLPGTREEDALERVLFAKTQTDATPASADIANNSSAPLLASPQPKRAFANFSRPPTPSIRARSSSTPPAESFGSSRLTTPASSSPPRRRCRMAAALQSSSPHAPQRGCCSP